MLAKKLSTEGQLDEKIFLRDLIHGDYKAFTMLYETHVAQLTNYAFKFTTDVQIIEDCIHDLFVWIWNNRTQLNITYSLKAYLFKSIRTSIITRIKKSKKVILISTEDEKEMSSFYISTDEEFMDEESSFTVKGKLANVVGMLTSKQKEVVYLRFYQGLSFDEIAGNMNLSTKACYKLMGRAIAELKKTCCKSWQYEFLFFLFFLKFMG